MLQLVGTYVQKNSSELACHKPEVVGPIGLIYVCQREYAATSPEDGIAIFCFILFLMYAFLFAQRIFILV